ncbi:MAG: hypothetical protein U0175_21870 [Caldilineaceae bacterium]
MWIATSLAPCRSPLATLPLLPMTDQELLRRFEPILRFTAGEQFFPLRVEPYIESCSLWLQRPNEPSQQLIPAGQLTMDALAQPRWSEFGSRLFLRLEANENEVRRNRRVQANQPLHLLVESFHAGRGRLARVGYAARVADALFSLSLLARGRVPIAAANVAHTAYLNMVQQNSDHVYYGRVVRQQRWLVLQYWFFYAYNNWRSGFSGANDHEADWEMICLYLPNTDVEERLKPEWVAYATHDDYGDDLRRRWDDAEVEKVGDHPVVYVGAGSHACYFRAGEYLTELELKTFSRLWRVLIPIQRFWKQQLHQYSNPEPESSGDDLANILRIPFVDYARGDGVCIGPDQAARWSETELLEPAPRWAAFYRGLWGLYTRDPFKGEDAPAGPKYNRNGSIRRSWYDPVGWAGLDKVPSADEMLEYLAQEQGQLRKEQEGLRVAIEERAQRLQGLGVRSLAMENLPHLYTMYQEEQRQIQSLSEETDELRAKLAASQLLSEAIDLRIVQWRNGEWGDLRSHIRRAHEPASLATLRFSRVAELWAAVSISLMILLLVALFYFARQYLAFGFSAVIALFAFVEASVRGHITRLITSINIGLTLAASLVLVYEFFWQIIVIFVVGAGIYILWDNLNELRK